MASKVTRTAVIAVSALGAGGVVAASAQAAPPTIPGTLVNQPAVSGISALTPESAVLHGVIDTGGNPISAFTLAEGATLTWDNSFVLTGGSTAAGTKYDVDGIPENDSTFDTYPLSTTGSVINNVGSGNYSTVLFEYDPASDYAANGDNPGPETGYATELNDPTSYGLSAVSAEVGGYPAASATSLSGALKPGTKYDYWIVQQAGATDQAETVNTFNPSSSTASTSTNPSYSCFPDSYISQVAPYSGYTATGTLSGGVSSAGTANTSPQPEIQGPCVYYYGGSSHYYTSNPGTFTTPKLGSVTVSGAVITAAKKSVTTTTGGKSTTTTTLSDIKAGVIVDDKSIEAAKGNFTLSDGGRQVASAAFSVPAGAYKVVKLNLTGYGKRLIAKDKAFFTRLVYTTTTDQPTTTRSVKL